MAGQAADAGFKAVKCAPFDECRAPFKTQGLPPEAEQGIERVRAAKDAIGPGSRLFVDCHSRFDLNSALALEPALRAAGAAWYEEPLDPIARSEDMRRIRDASQLPTAGAEHGYGLAAFKGLVGSGVLDIVMPDVKCCGGVSEAFRTGLELEGASPGSVSMHCPSGPLSLLTSAHVSAAFIAAADSGDGALPLEHAVFEVEWRHEVLWPRERIEKGDLALPAGPGLGAELDYSVILARGRKWSP
jgi:galactonate dehydratase